MIDFGVTAQSICETVGMIGIDASVQGTVETSDTFCIRNDVIILMGILADKKYNIAFAMEDSTAQSIAGSMMGMESYEMDEIGRSAIAELGNMIAGNIASSMDQDMVDITLPTVIVGQDICCMMQSFETKKMTFDIAPGPLEVYVALEG